MNQLRTSESGKSEIFGQLDFYYASATGWDIELDGLLQAGERISNMKRVILNSLGMTRKDDKLPERMKTPLNEGGSEGHVPDLEPMHDEYYQARGWDEKGVPTPKKLRSLGIIVKP